MSHRIGFAEASYPIEQVHEQMGACLPRDTLPLFSEDGRVRWRPRLLALAALLTAWQTAPTLCERFASTWRTLTGMFRGRRRAGQTYQGFAKALVHQSSALLADLLPWWRRRVLAWSKGHGRLRGWTLFGVDGTKINCPRSTTNEAALGCAGKTGSAPQQLLTAILHLGSWMPWAWRRGPGTDGERAHLSSMIDELPENAMLLADALYTSYGLLRQLTQTDCAFVVRAGANVKLLKKLNYYVKEHSQTVYLWPHDQQRQKQPPIVLRLIRLQDERSRQMCLLTNVLDCDRLPDQTAAQMYALRWGVEVTNRTLKQTLMRHTMQSHSPDRVAVELDWNVAALIVLALINLRVAIERGVAPLRRSPAAAVRLLRQWMHAAHKLVHLGLLQKQLADAEQDNYQRAGPKSTRKWCRKKQTEPPGIPSARKASLAEIKLAQQLTIAPPTD